VTDKEARKLKIGGEVICQVGKFKFLFMSRIGKQLINIPEKVEARIEGQKTIIKGPKGELNFVLPGQIKAEIKNGQIEISLSENADPKNKKKLSPWGRPGLSSAIWLKA